MIRVLLADDETMLRAGIRAILSADPDIEVVAEAADGRQAVEAARRHQPDVALVDIRMPELDGLAATAEIRRAVPATAVVILTTFGKDEYVASALDAGAAGFLLKAGDPRELLAGVRAAAGGAAYLSPKAAKWVVEQLGDRRVGHGAAARTRVGVLSARERQVLALLGAGLPNAEIARRLDLVEGTVKVYVSTIFDRLAVRNRVQAAVLAHQAGLVDDQ